MNLFLETVVYKGGKQQPVKLKECQQSWMI